MSNNNGGKFRKPKVYFTQVSNTALRDANLSLKAKGLYSLIQSYLTLEDFTLHKYYLANQCKEGEIAFESTWKELKDTGYLIQYRLQDDKTKQFYYEYELLNEKNIELAKQIHDSQNRKNKSEKAIPHKTEGMEKNQKAIPHKTEDMDNLYDGKHGIYNNTNLTNTNLTNTNLLVVEDAIINFEDNICKLKKTTKQQFIEYCLKYDLGFINSIVNLCAECGTKYFSGFKIIIEGYIEKGIITKDNLELHIKNYREESKRLREKEREKRKARTSKVHSNTYDKKDNFNNFEQRTYNFDSLEKKLLGWDK